MRLRRWLADAWPPATAILLLLAVWQLAAVTLDIPAWMLPSPLRIAEEAIAGFDRVKDHAVATTGLTLLGFAVGSGAGLLVGCILHLVTRLKAAVYPLLVLSQNIPMIAFAPLLVMWFGYGLLPKLIVLTLVCFFPIAISMLSGLAHTDPVMLNYMLMIGASRRDIFFKLELPSALPSLFSGLKIAATYSVMGAVIAEWLGSDRGIGLYMLFAKSAFRTDRLFVAILIVIALSLALFGGIALLERLTVRWRPQKAD